MKQNNLPYYREDDNPRTKQIEEYMKLSIEELDRLIEEELKKTGNLES